MYCLLRLPSSFVRPRQDPASRGTGVQCSPWPACSVHKGSGSSLPCPQPWSLSKGKSYRGECTGTERWPREGCLWEIKKDKRTIRRANNRKRGQHRLAVQGISLCVLSG